MIPFSIIVEIAVAGWMPVACRTERCAFPECWLQKRYLRFLVLPKISNMTFTFTVTVYSNQTANDSFKLCKHRFGAVIKNKIKAQLGVLNTSCLCKRVGKDNNCLFACIKIDLHYMLC